MKFLVLAIFMITSQMLIAQESNRFHDRSFWKTSPDVETVKEKIAEGNDPVALTASGFDAVTYAILENTSVETVTFLLSQEGNDINKSTHDGRNYLMWATNRGNLELMKMLIEKGSKTDIIDDHGNNLMTFAAGAGQQNPELYDLLLANGASIEDANRSGANALLLLAPSLKNKKMIQYFQQKGLDIHTKDNTGNGLFNYAARSGNMEMMRAFVEMGLDYKNLNDEGGNAMMFASSGSRGRSNPLSVYQYLEELGIEPNVKTKQGLTPLHNLAYRTIDPKIFDYFIEKGVDVNQEEGGGNTAFINAIRGQNLEIAKKLAPMIKDINHTNESGYSALTYAILGRSNEAFDMLSSMGADVNVIDQKGRNLIYHTFNSYRSTSHETFEKYMEILTSKGVDPLKAQVNGSSLLHLAIERREAALAKKALEIGIDINAKNDEGLTPLHLAAMKAKNGKMMNLLLENGADKRILTDFEESAYDLASENELLNESGIDLKFLKIDD